MKLKSSFFLLKKSNSIQIDRFPEKERGIIKKEKEKERRLKRLYLKRKEKEKKRKGRTLMLFLVKKTTKILE